MYYNEKYANGHYFYQNIPDGPWLRVSEKIIAARLHKAEQRIARLEEVLQKISDWDVPTTNDNREMDKALGRITGAAGKALMHTLDTPVPPITSNTNQQ